MSVENIKNPSVTEDSLALGLDSSGNIVSISGHYIAGGGGGGSISYTGRNGVSINGSYIELETSAKNAVDAVNGISTDVGTLKNASAGWNEVTAKLDSSLASTTYQTKTDMANYLTTSDAATTYQPKGDYASASDIVGMATQTWVGLQGFYTKASGDNDYAPKSVTSTINTLTGASAGWDKVSAKLDASAFSDVSGTFLTAIPNNYATKEYANNASANALSEAKSWVGQQGYLSAVPDTYALKTDIPTTVAQLTDSENYYKKTETSSTGELDTAFGNKQNNLTQEQLSAISSVSSIKGTILTGDSNILATSAEVGNNIKWTLQLTAQPVVTDTTLSGYDGIVATKDSSVTSQWNVGIAQAYKEQIEAVSSKLTKTSADTLYAPISVTGDVDTLKSSSGDWDKVSDKLDTTAFSTVSGSFLTAHQSLDNYYTKTQVDSTFASATQLNDYLTTSDAATTYQQKGDYAPESVTATINTLTAASAGWNEVTSKLDKSIYSNASGNWENTYNVVNQYSAAGTWLTAHQSLTNYYTKDETSGASELSTEFAKYQPKGDYATSAGLTAGNQYAMTTTGWEVVQGGTSFTGVTTTGSISGGGANNDTIGLLTSSENALTSVANKVDKPDTTQTVLNNNYLIYSTLTGAGTTTGWMPLSANYYSKTEADGRYQKKEDMSSYLTTAQYATDSATFVTSSSNTITGTKQYALTTTGWGEVNGFTGASADNGLSGNGMSSSPLGLHSSAAKTISAAKYEEINTNMLAQKLLVVTSDQQIINYVQGGGANNEGCIFFVTSAHT